MGTEWMKPTELLSGFATGRVALLLRAEGLVVFAAAMFAYHRFGGGTAFFLLTFLIPDLSMLGYLIGSKMGANCYNVAHTYILAAIVILAGQMSGEALILWAGCVWVAHIGFDRLLGYGLKYPDAFGHTHLGLVGKLAAAKEA